MSATGRWTRAVAALLASVTAIGCHESRPSASGNSNWQTCRSDDDCERSQSCESGICTDGSDSAVPRPDAAPMQPSGAQPDACAASAAGCGSIPPAPVVDASTAPPDGSAAPPVRSIAERVQWNAPASWHCAAGVLRFDSGSDMAWAVAIAEDSLLIAGTEDVSTAQVDPRVAWRIDRRRLTDLMPIDGFGSGGAVGFDGMPRATPAAMAVDPDFIYAAGFVGDHEQYRVLLEKRSLATGARVTEFGVAGAIEAQELAVYGDFPRPGLVLDGAHIYTTEGAFDVAKRYVDDGDLVTAFGAMGKSQSAAAPGSFAQALVLGDGILYAGGSEGSGGLRLEARDAGTGELVYEVVENSPDVGCSYQGIKAMAVAGDALILAGTLDGRWMVERRLRSTGQLVYRHDLSSQDCDVALALAIDSTAMYVAGRRNTRWRIEKRSLADGVLMQGFGQDGVTEMDDGRFGFEGATSVTLNEGVLYVAGFDVRMGSVGDWRIERRLAEDGALLDCPAELPDVPGAPHCESEPTVEDATDVAGAQCTVRVARSLPCSGASVQASGDATNNEEWRLHYSSDSSAWGLAVVDGFAQPTDYLALRGFGFALPADAQVLGIAVGVDREGATSGSIRDQAVRLIKAGEITAADRSLSGNWAQGLSRAEHGGAGDLWDTAWTAADINDPNFGVALRIAPTGGTDDNGAQVDEVYVRVYYCEP